MGRPSTARSQHLGRACAALSLLLATPAFAEVREPGARGFTSHHEAEFGAPPAEVYRTLTEGIGQWWSGDHSWSGDAANFYFDARPGGCFCERLPDGGFAEHLRVVFLWPGRQARLEGALGPLGPMGFSGTMNWVLEPMEDAGTRLRWTYLVRGPMPAGDAGASLAAAVDAVNGEQVARLGKLLAGQ